MDTIPCLSVMQPWARLLFEAKDCENRTRSTRHRGQTLIQATQRFDREGWEYLVSRGLVKVDDLDKYMADRGTVLGCIDIVDCTLAVTSSWHWDGQFGLYRGPDPILFPPEMRMAVKGRRGGLFDVEITEAMKGFIMGRKKRTKTTAETVEAGLAAEQAAAQGEGTESTEAATEGTEDVLVSVDVDETLTSGPVEKDPAVETDGVDWDSPSILRRCLTQECFRDLSPAEMNDYVDKFFEAAGRKADLKVELAEEKKRIDGEIACEEKVMNEIAPVLRKRRIQGPVDCVELIDPVTRKGRIVRLDTGAVTFEFTAKDSDLQTEIEDAAATPLLHPEPGPGFWDSENRLLRVYKVDKVFKTGYESTREPGRVYWLYVPELPDRKDLDSALEDLISYGDTNGNKEWQKYLVGEEKFIEVRPVDGMWRAMIGNSPEPGIDPWDTARDAQAALDEWAAKNGKLPCLCHQVAEPPCANCRAYWPYVQYQIGQDEAYRYMLVRSGNLYLLGYSFDGKYFVSQSSHRTEPRTDSDQAGEDVDTYAAAHGWVEVGRMKEVPAVD